MLSRGIGRGFGELWDILLGPFQPTDDAMTNAACGWSEELSFKYFSSEKRLRFLVLLSVSCHGNENRFSAIVSVVYWVLWDKDVK